MSKLEFSAKEIEIEPKTQEFDIKCDDLIVGKVIQAVKTHGVRYHAIIPITIKDHGTMSLDQLATMSLTQLAQGHGESPQEATRNALVDSKQEAEEYIVEIDRLHKMIFG